MNIFATDPDPVACAQFLDNQRLVKMILESCQILSTALDGHGLRPDGFPRPTHAHHPCVIWASEGRVNSQWLYAHAWAMDVERRRRFGSIQVHKTLDQCHRLGIERKIRRLPMLWTPHVNCARNGGLGIDFTWMADTHAAYRRYLKARWALQERAPSWT